MSFAKNFANRDAWRRFPMLAYSSGVRHSGGAAAPRRAASARPRSRRPPRAGAAGRAWARGRDSCAPGAPIECARARAAGRAAGAGDRARGGRPRGPVSLRGASTTARALGPRRRHFPRVPGRRQTGPEEGRPRSPLVRRRRASRRVTEIGRVVATFGAGARSRRAGRSRAAAAADIPDRSRSHRAAGAHHVEEYIEGNIEERLP